MTNTELEEVAECLSMEAFLAARNAGLTDAQAYAVKDAVLVKSEALKQDEAACQHAFEFNTFCGADICSKCDQHKGLARCFCGWAISGGDGRKELEEDGETIDEEE